MTAKISRRTLKAGCIQFGVWLLLVAASLLFGVSAAFAGGAAGDDVSDTETAKETDCLSARKNHQANYLKVCGAGFTKRSVDNIRSFPWYDNEPNNTTKKREVANTCKSVGASEVYILAVNGTKLSSDGTRVVHVNDMFGLWTPVKQLGSTWGGSGYVPYLDAFGAEKFADVHDDWETAYRHAQKHPEDFKTFLDTPWLETTWFCWDPAWDNDSSHFNSWSYASADGLETFTTFSVPDSTQERDLSVTTDKVQVNFSHQLSYVHPQTDGVYDPVSTSWSTQVTIDGVATGNTSSGVYTPNVSGPAQEDEFSPNNLGAVNLTVDIEANKTKKVCSTITYERKNFVWLETESQPGHFSINYNEPSSNGSSTICITIKRGDAPDPDGEFTSQSFGKVTNGESFESLVDGMLDSSNPKVSEVDQHVGDAGLVGYSIGLEDQSTSVDFWHKITYTINPTKFTAADTVPKVETAWTIDTKIKRLSPMDENGRQTEGSWEELGTTAHGSYSPDSAKTTQTSGELQVGHSAINIDIEKGQTVLVCSTIRYSPKYVKFTVKTNGDIDGDRGHTLDHIRYDYELKEENKTGSGSSQACVWVYRPIEPQGTPWSGSSGGGGDTLSKIMYAGEKTEIGWNVWAQGSLFNRVSKFQAFNYVASTSTQRNDSVLQGTSSLVTTSNSAPCNFTSSLWSSTGLCSVISEHSGGAQSIFFDKRNESEAIVSPNEVGSKHGNSAAYFYEVWAFDCHTYRCRPYWHHHSWDDYWHVYNTASRSVAKRPSVAIWNGGITTGSGNITTSLAPRYTNAKNISYLPVGSGGNINRFGSWAEYLAVIGGAVTAGQYGFTSGSVLSTGLGSESFDLLANSPLTIANTGSEAGYSDVKTDNILRDRLDQYFFSSDDAINISNSFTGGQYNKTTIMKVNGDLTISGNITLDKSSSSTVYDLPQVLIYASGNITIADNVDHIDAWLVTDGVLKTCGGFNAGETEALVTGASHTECSVNLQINGPVFAKSVEAKRTYGADGISPGNGDSDTAGGTDSRAAAAEVFNLSADAYLWAYAQAGRYNSSYTEAYSRELPPRY